MKDIKRSDFCINCRKETEYIFKKIDIEQTIRDKTYNFLITNAYCTECGCEMSIPGIFDLNAAEVDSQYRATENIITISDINKLMKIYNIGKAPLSLALGFGEVTISRYLAGQIPSKEYSEIMYQALQSHEYMESLLNRNRDKVGETAYKKSMQAIKRLKQLFTISSKMLMAIAYIFEELEEVTDLALQKLLYYIQGLYIERYNIPLFPEMCEAWAHGPVYREVYSLFRDFKYNPIDDPRFALFSGKSKALSAAEKDVIDLVLKTFGMYSGKTLERITHIENPWCDARKGCSAFERSTEIISNASIAQYFRSVSEQYQIRTEDGVNQYIYSMLKKSSYTY